MSDFTKLRIGLFGIGLAAYWEQFPGLKERLAGYVDAVDAKLQAPGRVVVNFGLVDSPEAALALGHEVRRQDIDFLVLYVTTYALSSTVLPIVRRAGLPVLILNLQPAAALDYSRFNALPDRAAMTGEWLAYCSACPVPEIANVFSRTGVPYMQVTGVLQEDPECWSEIGDWMQAAEVAHTLSHTRLGLMGHYYSGMLDIATDLTALCSIFGVQIDILEVDELSRLVVEVTAAQMEEKSAALRTAFDLAPDCSRMEIERSARTSVALDRFADRHRLNALAYYYKGSGVELNENTISSIILGASLLTGRGIPVAGEYEVKNAIAMKIMDAFGAGGSFSEYYAVDFADDVVLLGHDGPGHPGIAEGKTRVRPLDVFHGKVGSGLSVEMSVKSGPVTLLSVAECRVNGFKLVVAEGYSELGPILEIGNTNSRYRFSCGARKFVNGWNEQAPAHHCAIGVGHIAGKILKLARLLKIDAVQIC
jgi:L-arabinose isomerase